MLPPPIEGSATPMLDRLRAATRTAHAALEDSLALLRAPLSRARFAQTLAGFHAFHRAWEPRMAALIGDEALTGPRRRLTLIEQDLETLGVTAGPRVPFAVDFLADRSCAWGSLYVMEGSTLGGQMISKALRREAEWTPETGLAYFNPYGRRTAAMWRGFCDALERQAPSLEPDGVVQGARETFRALEVGLAPRLRAAA